MDAKNIAAFCIGGIIPVEHVGLVLKALYQADAIEMKMEPVYVGVSDKSEIKRPLPPTASKLPKPEKKITELEAYHRLLKESRGPLKNEDAIKALHGLGYAASNLSTDARTLIKRGLIKKVGVGLYEAIS